MYTVDARLRAPTDLNRLFTAGTTADVGSLVAALTNAKWRPYGDQDGNFTLINATADSLDAIIEKVINGQDGLIELFASLKRRTDYPNPREAVEDLFQVPKGHLEFLPDADRRRRLAEMLTIALRPGDSDDRPSVVVTDHGIGQHPDDFPKTLVSLNANNKRDKFWLLGAYGWGGAAGLAYCQHMMFISRRNPQLLGGRPDDVGFTITRFNDLAKERTSKTGVYEYLVMPDEQDPRGVVPRFPASHLPAQWREWSGTMCIMVGYELGRDTARTAAFLGAKSLRNVSNALAFDPVLPFMVKEERPKYAKSNPDNARGVIVVGNAARLAELAARRKAKQALREQRGEDLDKEDREIGVDYDDYFDATLPTGGQVRVRWWVMGQSKDTKKEWEPARNYVPREQAITLTHNGQRHAAWSRQQFEDWGFTSLAKGLVVQVEADNLDWTEKRRLFATTRDQLRRTEIAQDLRVEVKKALQQDPYLRREEQRRRQRALGHESKEQTERIQKLLQNAIAGFRDGNVDVFHKLMSANRELPLYDNQPLAEPEPNPIDEPDVDKPDALNYQGPPTFVRVLNQPVHVPAGTGRAIIRLHIDAPDDYFEGGGGEFLPLMTRGKDIFRLDGYSSLRNGFMRCTLSAPGAQPGEKGRVIFTVTRPGDTLPISDDAELVADEPPRPRVKKAAKQQPGKEQGPPIEICRREQWGELGFDETTVAKLLKDPGDPELFTIWVNWNYGPLDEKLLREKKLSDELASSFKERFVAAMGFLVWLQKKAEVEINNEELRRAAEVHLFSTFVDAKALLT